MPCSGHSLTTCHGWDTILRHALVGTQFPTCRGRDAALYVLWGHSYSTCPGWEAVISTFPDRDIALQHARIRTQFYDIPWSERSFTTCPGWDAIVRYACSGHNLTTCQGWNTVLRHVVVETQYYMFCGDTVIQHVLVRTQFSDIAWSGAVIRHALVGGAVYNMPCSGHNLTTCSGRDTVLRHAMVGTQFYGVRVTLG